MKKILIFVLLFMFFFIYGCSPKQVITIDDDSIILRIGDTYQLQPKTENETVYHYTANNDIVEINDGGLISAKKVGESIVTISAKNSKSLNVTIEVLKNTSPLRVHFIDVGQADCILVILPNEETLLIDAGLDHFSATSTGNYPSWNHIQEVLSAENITVIDHLIITHNHADHYYYVPDILDKYTVKNVYTSGSTRTNNQYLYIMRSIENAGLNVQVVGVGDKIIDEKYLTLQVVSTKRIPNETEDEVNYSSVMVKLTYINKAFLFTGDAGAGTGDGEDIALASGIDLKSDVLKVGHHGSYKSSGARFLKAVKPQYAIITTAKVTETGHPHEAALMRLENIGATIYQSKDNGTITITTDGFAINVETER